MQGEGSFDGGSHVGEAVLEHASRAGAALLCGLEGEVHRAAEGGLAGFEHAGGAEEHGGVAVVAAGVHLAGDAAAAILGHVGFLRQRQRVHVRAEEHDGGAAADRGEDAGGGELLERDTHRRELALHDGRGCSLRPHQFGRQVELATDADDVVRHGRRVGEDRRGIERGGVAGRHGRRGRGGGIGARLGRRRHAGRDDERDREERERQPAKGGHLERTNGRARGRRARI